MGYTSKQLSKLMVDKLRRTFGRDISEATPADMFQTCALVLRDIMSANRVETREKNDKNHVRRVHYLSLEFLMGRSLEKNAFNLGVLPQLQQALESLGFSASDLFELEPDAGLGNGGLGRLAACYLESMSTQEIPSVGYSICYELGIFKQKIVDGQQVELPDHWLELGGSWLVTRPEETEEVHFGGQVEVNYENGKQTVRHTGYTTVLAVPRDMKIAGYKTTHTNRLRLWDAKSANPVDFSQFSSGRYLQAVEEKAMAEAIAKVLYPEDNHPEGKMLRLRQQYFFVSATVQSIMRRHKIRYGTLRNFHEKHTIQINDTHPTLVIPEMMRILMDEEGFNWDDAWYVTTHTVSYTNHTVLAEALEKWPQDLIINLLPRIWLILDEISQKYQRQLEKEFHGDMDRVGRNAIIWDGQVRMANLCICACQAINGVSALHTEILKNDVFNDAYRRDPKKFFNVTNGIDHRRWLAQINPALDQLMREAVGASGDYLLRPELMAQLEKKAPVATAKRLGEIKKANKEAFANWYAKETGIILNTDAMFDVQVKRLHEYKRQLLNAMHIIYLYQKLKEDPSFKMTPRVYLFGAKAAPGYAMAKQIIHLINSLAATVNADPVCKDKLQVVFLENYRVSLAEKLMPAAELSEQISTAGKEASGTGNMKFMMNGALTIGTLDGANVEMCQQVGEDNMFLFGLTAQQVEARVRDGYRSYEYYSQSETLKRILDQMTRGFDDGVSYTDIVNSLLFGQNGGMADQYFLLADFESYRAAQALAGETYLDQKKWNQMALVNVARSGLFAADRAVAEYAKNIWHVPVRKD